MSVEDKIVKRLDELIDKGDKVIDTAEPEAPGSSKMVVDQAAFAPWRLQILNLLTQSLGQNHIYLEEFESRGYASPYAYTSAVKRYQGVLRALREDILGGYLADVKTLISAEVFDDFLDMADHLLECSYKDPAASLCGAVLENGLRRVASNAGVKLKSREDLGSLNHKCADAGIYTRLVQKKIQVWNDIRNNADHGKFNEYLGQDVQDMLKGVRQFLEDHLH